MTEPASTTSRRGLAPEAYEEIPGDQYPPYVPSDKPVPEFTFKAIIFGIIVAILFGAANAYLGLRVGLTVSASIPAAVMAVAVFRITGRGTVLETNIVQTIGSAGESLAAGVIFTIPALFIWQRTDPTVAISLVEITMVALFGGILGVLFMIPLRAFLISREHGKLPYPEGTACAEVQVAGDAGGSRARLLIEGLGLGAVFKLLEDGHGFRLWQETPTLDLPKKAQISGDFTPELVGVGFILGPKIAAIMFSGGALAWLILIPLINAWGGDKTIYPGTMPIGQMGAGEIWNRYIRYVGAGGVAFGGLITLIKSLPTIWKSFTLGVGALRDKSAVAVKRTDRDLSLKIVGIGALFAILGLWLWPKMPVNFVGAVLIAVFAFFFVTVSSRIVGLVGSTSNPISGMTIATLLATAFIFVALGYGNRPGARVDVLMVGAVVAIASAIAGDTSQDLKTGFLLGATPSYQQIGELIGVLASALVMGWILITLNATYGIGTGQPGSLAAPQATIISLVIDGVLRHNLPWAFVFLGAGLAAIVEFVFRLPSLAFAVGLYLPISLTLPIMVGGGIRGMMERRFSAEEVREQREPGVLFSSGLIAGAAVIGVVIAGVIRFAPGLAERVPNLIPYESWAGAAAPWIGTAMFAGLCWLLYRKAVMKVD